MTETLDIDGQTIAYDLQGDGPPVVLIVEGSADPDWADPRAEGERIVADLPAGTEADNA